jgi:putative DNA primase/helicase
VTVVDLPFPFEEGSPNPFDADSVNLYRRRKWLTLIPLPYGKQTPPPSGFTGRFASSPDADQLKAWIRESRAGAKNALSGKKTAGPYNIAIIHDHDTIALDVDDYDYIDKKSREKKHKYGGKSLTKLEAKLGKLPTTWVSSARGAPDKNPSGQRFFRLKPEHHTNKLRYNDKPADSIEIVRAGHRYSVVWPSMNGRLGEQYVWWKSSIVDGVRIWKVSNQPPAKQDLPYLPDKWVEYLTSGFTPYDEKKKVAPGKFGRSEMVAWINERAKNNSIDEDGAGEEYEPPPCRAMQKALKNAIDTLDDSSGGAHDTMNSKLWYVMQLASEGHSGLKVFLKEFHDAFVDEVQGRRDGGKHEAEGEWQRSLIGGFEGALARTEPIAAVCPCFRSDADGGGGFRTDIDPAEIDLNDDGNAELLVSMTDGNLRWSVQEEQWMVWDQDLGIWKQDNQFATVLARAVGKTIQERAKEMFHFIRTEGPTDKDERAAMEKRAKRLYQWGVDSGNRSKIRNMLDLSRSYEGISTSSQAMNADSKLLVCKNGTVELATRQSVGTMDGMTVGEPIKLRESSRDDLNTITTGIDYVPWGEIRKGGDGQALLIAREYVEDYLDTFLPDRDLRWYIQRVFGYGLYGANPERKIVFLQGNTSTGKSTILAAISGALGGYSGPFNLSLLRDKQDEGPRVELVNSLQRRIITASESSVEWHLHADMIKRVTGGSDVMSARKLYSNEMVERVPAFTPFVATNSAPTIDAADSATWRRLIVLPFDIQVGVNEDADSSLQKAGMDAFMATDLGCRMVWLSWLIDGYIGYVNEGIQNAPEIVQKRIKLFQSGVSDFHTFLHDMIIHDETVLGQALTTGQIYSAYEAWCFEHRIKESQKLSKIAFGRKLSANGFEMVRRFPRAHEPQYVENRKNRYTYVEHCKFVSRSERASDDGGDKFDMEAFESQFQEES